MSFSANRGSLLNLNDKVRWGSSPCSVQARWTGMWLLPRDRASDRVDQWVLPRGFSEVVARRIRRTRWATGAVGGRCAERPTEVPPVGAGRSADTRGRECGDGFREPLRSDLSIGPGQRQGRSERGGPTGMRPSDRVPSAGARSPQRKRGPWERRPARTGKGSSNERFVVPMSYMSLGTGPRRAR